MQPLKSRIDRLAQLLVRAHHANGDIPVEVRLTFVAIQDADRIVPTRLIEIAGDGWRDRCCVDLAIGQGFKAVDLEPEGRCRHVTLTYDHRRDGSDLDSDLGVLVKALDDWSARVAGAFLRDFHFQSSERAFNRSGRDVSYTIRIRSESPPPPIPGGLKDFEVAFGHCYVDGNTYYLHIEDSLVVVGPGGTELIDVWIGKSDHARGLLSLVNVMSYALDAALRRCGLYQLHGAGVAPPKDGDAQAVIDSRARDTRDREGR